MNSRWEDLDHVDIGLGLFELSPDTHGERIQSGLRCAITNQGAYGHDGKVGLGAIP